MRASTRTSRAGALPELNSVTSKSKMTCSLSSTQRSGVKPMSIHGRSRVDDDAGRRLALAASRRRPEPRAARRRIGRNEGIDLRTAGEGLARCRLRQNRNAPPAPSASAASSHGTAGTPSPASSGRSGCRLGREAGARQRRREELAAAVDRHRRRCGTCADEGGGAMLAARGTRPGSLRVAAFSTGAACGAGGIRRVCRGRLVAARPGSAGEPPRRLGAGGCSAG